MTDRILVIEDNIPLAENVAEMLVDEGVEITLCTDAESAARLATERGFELAIVDIGLGGKESGLDLLPKLRRASVHGEILLMTGNASLQSAIQAIRSGVYAYVPKPFDPEQFTTLVRRALAQVALKQEKHALTQRLAASEALYRGVVDTAEACILGLDAAGAIRFCNRYMSERLDLSQSDLLGRSFFSLSHPESLPGLRTAMARAVAGDSIRDQEAKLELAGSRTIRWTFTPLTAGNLGTLSQAAQEREGELPVVLAVGIDLTDRLELERKNAEGEALAAMGTLATSLAHEIRNPLNAAKLQLELLIRRASKLPSELAGERIWAPAELVRTELDRLSSLLGDFLNLARPRQLLRQPCRVSELLDSVVTLKAPLAQSAGVALLTQVTEPELTVHADADKLKQVLINLVGNAIDALRDAPHEPKRIELSAATTAQGAMISVADNGPGVSPELAKSAFDPFITSKAGGTGLGLAIVAKIMAQHGGTAELVPREGGGTVARFVIPT